MTHQKHYHFLPGEVRWRAWRPTPVPPERQAFEPGVSGTHEPDVQCEEVISQAKALQQWLDAGGKPGNASLYHVEIFVGPV
jgi:hypothetical protein